MREFDIEISPGVCISREDFETPPYVQWNHVDGPLLHWRGQVHWLTVLERILLFLGFTTVNIIAYERIKS